MMKVVFPFLVSSSILVVLVVRLLEPLECVLHMVLITVNKLMHWIHRYATFAATPRSRKWSTRKICSSNMMLSSRD